MPHSMTRLVVFYILRPSALDLCLYRASQWSCGYPTWSPPKVRLFAASLRFSQYSIKGVIAISDAVRTSLGPRGMDKMVLKLVHLTTLAHTLDPDPNIQGRDDHNQRWRNNSKKHPGFTSCCENGAHRPPALVSLLCLYKLSS